MRVYLPATLPLLRAWLAAGHAPPGAATAVTPALREWYREGSEEEMEYVAQLAAGRLSLGLLDGDPDAPRRRVVVAADVPDLDVAVADGGRSAVVVAVPVPVSAWASVLVDDEEADSFVSAAVTALGAAAAGDDDAAFALDEVAAQELGWHAVQELDHLFGDA
jgi:hypothetical protein